MIVHTFNMCNLYFVQIYNIFFSVELGQKNYYIYTTFGRCAQVQSRVWSCLSPAAARSSCSQFIFSLFHPPAAAHSCFYLLLFIPPCHCSVFLFPFTFLSLFIPCHCSVFLFPFTFLSLFIPCCCIVLFSFAHPAAVLSFSPLIFFLFSSTAATVSSFSTYLFLCIQSCSPLTTGPNSK